MPTTECFIYTFPFAIIVILIGWFLGSFFFEKRDYDYNYDYNYEHFLMQENGYNYCPYCGEELKIEYKEDEE